MPTKIFLIIAFFTISFFSNAQDESLLIVATIPSELTVKANAVVRYDYKKIEIASLKSLNVTRKRIVTVLNKEGNRSIDAYVNYDDGIDVKKIEARIYDHLGNQIKKIKKSDFEDVSAANDFSLYEDSRVKYLNYTPTVYPYTVEFYYETSTENTAFLPSWYPLEGYYVSTEKSIYEIAYASEIQVKHKEYNFNGYKIENKNQSNTLLYEVNNLKSIKPEAYSPDFNKFSPHLKVALNKFYYEGYYGEANDWSSLGKWMYDELLVDRTELPETTKAEIMNLVTDVDDQIERAKIVYQYVQDRTRYISVQEGIGGIQPIKASKVDEVKYGDCKGLTNYTKALMDVVGVKTNYSRVFGSRNTVDIDKDFVTFLGQTNHVILNLPTQDGDIWLECTSQTNPFGYNANFTDDRDVFVITPEGGKIVHTTVYKTEESLQETKANINLDSQGSISGNVNIQTEGYQYALHEGIQNRPTREQDLYFKKYWDYLNNLNIDKIEFINDKDNVVFTENVDILATNYATKSGKRLLFQPNVFNRVTNIPTRYKNRTLDFEIERGFVDKDEFVINIDPTLQIEAMPDSVVITNKFGSYEFSIEKRSDSVLLYKRTYVLNKGYYSKEEYEEFRTFRANVVKHDKTKIVFVTKP